MYRKSTKTDAIKAYTFFEFYSDGDLKRFCLKIFLRPLKIKMLIEKWQPFDEHLFLRPTLNASLYRKAEPA